MSKILSTVMMMLLVGMLTVAEGSTGFREDFSELVLDPVWTVTNTYPGHGYYSLTGNSLRYYVQAWSHPWDTPSSGYFPSMRLSREFSGDNWIFETKVTYYMPYSNGRQLYTFVSFGSSLDQVFQDMNNNIVFYRTADSGPGVENWTATIDGVTQEGSVPISGTDYDTHYFRIVRKDKELTLLWSSDGQNWSSLYNTQMSDQTAGLFQYVILSGASWATPAGSYEEYDYIYIEPSVIPVLIDIKPGGFHNSINLKSKGKIPVAILSSPTFDATTVDWNTVVFAGASPLLIGQKPEDVNGDGLLDIVLHFNIQDLSLQPSIDTEACLTGKTLDEQEFEGCDSISIVKNCKKKQG